MLHIVKLLCVHAPVTEMFLALLTTVKANVVWSTSFFPAQLANQFRLSSTMVFQHLFRPMRAGKHLPASVAFEFGFALLTLQSMPSFSLLCIFEIIAIKPHMSKIPIAVSAHVDYRVSSGASFGAATCAYKRCSFVCKACLHTFELLQ